MLQQITTLHRKKTAFINIRTIAQFFLTIPVEEAEDEVGDVDEEEATTIPLCIAGIITETTETAEEEMAAETTETAKKRWQPRQQRTR